jgi:hypothetical protein
VTHVRATLAPVVMAAAVLAGVSAAGCGTAARDSDSPAPVTTPAAAYCADVDELTQVLTDGGSVSRYDEILRRVVAGSPPEHQASWALLLSVSEEPFSYERFGRAADSFEQTAPMLAATCPDLDPWIVIDDDGRLRVYAETP